MNSAHLNSINKRRVCVGVISGAHGIAGQVRIKPFTELPQDVLGYGPLTRKDDTVSIEIVSSRVVKNNLVVKIGGVNSRTEAEALRGTELFVDREALSEPDIDEWYYSDLIGLKVVDPAGQVIGSVLSIQNYGAGDLIEMNPEAGGDPVLVPFTASFVPDVDISNARITVIIPEGGLEYSDDGSEENYSKQGDSRDG